MPGKGHYRPMPEDFMEHCHESTRALIRRYRAGGAAVSRWKALAGTLRPWRRGVVRIDADGNEKAFETCREAAEEGIIINPWDKSFVLTKELIRVILDADQPEQ